MNQREPTRVREIHNERVTAECERQRVVRETASGEAKRERENETVREQTSQPNE